MDGERYTVVVSFELLPKIPAFGGSAQSPPPRHRTGYYIVRFNAEKRDYVINDGDGDALNVVLYNRENIRQEIATSIKFYHMPDRAAGIRQAVSEVQDYLAGAAVLAAERRRLQESHREYEHQHQKRARTEETETETETEMGV